MEKKDESKAPRVLPLVKILDVLGVFNLLIVKLLEKTVGKVHIMITVGNKQAIEVIFEEPLIILEIKNPILAVEAGLEEMLKRKDAMKLDSEGLESLKKTGYRIKLRYRGLEYEL